MASTEEEILAELQAAGKLVGIAGAKKLEFFDTVRKQVQDTYALDMNEELKKAGVLEQFRAAQASGDSKLGGMLLKACDKDGQGYAAAVNVVRGVWGLTPEAPSRRSPSVLLSLIIFGLVVYGLGYLGIYGFFADPPIPYRWWLLGGSFLVWLILNSIRASSMRTTAG